MKTTNREAKAAAERLLTVAEHVETGEVPWQVRRIIDDELLHGPPQPDNPHPPGWLLVRYNELVRTAGDDGLEEAATIETALRVLGRIMRDKRLPDEQAQCQRLVTALKRAARPYLAGDGQDGDDQDWMLVSEAVAELPFVGNLKALYRYVKKHPDQLRLRDHPHHKKRRQAHRADVQRLVQEHNEKELTKLDGTAADDLPAISENGMQALAARMTAERAKKAGK